MLTVKTDDGVNLVYETTGSGTPIVFVHEFAGHKESWEPQVRHFSRQYQVITYNARGYPPSAVPPEVSSYSQNRAVADIIAVMDHLKIDKAHIVGLSMGGFATLHFGLQHPHRALSLCVAGCGYGAELEQQEQFKKEAEASADMLLKQGMKAFVDKYAHGPTRLSFETRRPTRLCRVQATVLWTFSTRLSQHTTRCPARTSITLQPEKSACQTHRPHPDFEWRRRLALPKTRPHAQRNDSIGRVGDIAQLRTYDEH